MKGKGVISSIDGNRAKVRVDAAAECGGCASQGHCGMGDKQEREIVVINDYGARVSDYIVFEADSGKVILSSLLIWVVPVLAMIVGYSVAQQFATGFIPIAASFLFLGLTFVVLKFVDTKISGGSTFYPRITGIARITAESGGCSSSHND